MDPRGRAVYKEWSSWPGWIMVVFWGAILLSLVTTLVTADQGGEGGIGATVIVALVAGTIQWLVAGLSVRLYRDSMVVGIGTSGWISRRIRYTDILRLESLRYHPLREFGGWGVRGVRGKRAWTARGDQAVVLHLVDGTRLYVGSDHPRRLEERIRAIAGTRLGSGAGAPPPS